MSHIFILIYQGLIYTSLPSPRGLYVYKTFFDTQRNPGNDIIVFPTDLHED